MAADRGLAPWTVLIGWLVLAPALLAVGSGPINGDAAAYGAQATAGVVADRWTHLGYLAPAAVLARLVDVWLALDVVSWLSAAAAVAAAARIAARDGGDPWFASVLAAAVLVPWAPFAEVDLPWIAAALLAVAGSPAWIGLSIAVSPTALLALPWVFVSRREGRGVLLGWASVTILALTVLSAGGWWTGERGVLTAGPLALGKTAAAFGWHLPWLVALLVRPDRLRGLLWCLPLVLAPPDVPAWLIPGVAAACVVRTPRWAPIVVLAQLGLGAAETVWRVRRVRAENALVARVVAELGPDDGLVAPWTWGARVAVAASGDPYGIRWHPPGRFLRDQRESWCDDPPGRALVLPSDGVWLDGDAIVAGCVSPR